MFLEKYFKMAAKTLFGLEETLAGELENLGAKDIAILNRAVQFWGGKELAYRANLHLRTALRIYIPALEFEVFNENDLYRNVKQFDWSRILNPQMTFAVDSTVNSQYFNHENYVALKTKDAVADQLRSVFAARPDVDILSPSVRLHTHISGSKCTISLDSSGDSLHKRSYRAGQVKAPINEVLAAGMVMLSGWRGQSDFIDPMCGSGTILMEAASIAYNTPPGIKIKKFGFMTWKGFDAELWKKIKNEAKIARRNFPHTIKGFDASPRAIKIAEYNIKNAGLGWKIPLKVKKIERLSPEEAGGQGSAIINPPYGERMPTDEIVEFYKKIGDSLKQNFDGWDCWVISSNKEALKHLGLRPSKRLTLFNGSLECKYHKFEVYKGSKKAKYNN